MRWISINSYNTLPSFFTFIPIQIWIGMCDRSVACCRALMETDAERNRRTDTERTKHDKLESQWKQFVSGTAKQAGTLTYFTDMFFFVFFTLFFVLWAFLKLEISSLTAKYQCSNLIRPVSFLLFCFCTYLSFCCRSLVNKASCDWLIDWVIHSFIHSLKCCTSNTTVKFSTPHADPKCHSA